MGKNFAWIILLFSAVIVIFSPLKSWAGQPLETETTRVAPAGTIDMEVTGEYQTSSDGQELAFPLVIEYSITNDLEIMIEPVPFTAIVPSSGEKAQGLGDTEITGTLRFFKETEYLPDMALALELKYPTAKNALIGTGQTDYTGYFIMSKFFGPVDVHLNLGYSNLGRVPGIPMKDTFDYGVAAEWFINKQFDLVGEVVGNTAATSESLVESGTAVTPEIAGGEVVGMVGMRWHLNKGLSLCLGVTYDNNNAVLIRPGLTWVFNP